MIALQELARVVSEGRLDNVAVFNVYNRKDGHSLYNQFLNGILSAEFKSDEEAAKLLYGVDKDDVKYRVLKNRLKSRLYNNILFINSGKRASSSYYGVWCSLHRHMVVAKFLIGYDAKNAGMELMNKVLNKALKYELHDIVQQCAIIFRRQYMLNGDIKKFDYYNNLFKQSNDRLMAEVHAEELYYTVLINFNKSYSLPPELIALSKRCSEQINELAENHPTYLINYYDNSIQSIYYQLINDYKSSIESCTKFENYLLANKIFYSNTRMVSVLLNKAYCFLHLNNFADGIKSAEKALRLCSPDTDNWFSVAEIHFLLLLNNNSMDKATDSYIEVTGNLRFTFLRPQLQESWKIYGGYLWFLLNYYKNDKCLNKLSTKKQSFRFSKLQNEIPVFSKDKKGMNVAVLVLQVLLLLQKKDYVKIISRTEALKSYIYRNLAKDDAYRSHIFIKMVLAMEKAQFDLEKTKQKTKDLLAEMKKGDLKYTYTQTRMEIIPYERLWDIVLDLIR